MRVTMQSIYSNILLNLNKINIDMNRINQQISSGKQMSSISDNPVNLVNALGLRTNLSEMGQYQKNLKYGETIISASENALVSMKDLVMRAKTLAIQQANAPMTPENRRNAATEVKHLWEQAIILANSAVGGKHIFGGFRTTGYTPAEPAPFVQGARDGYYVNGSGMASMPTSLTGKVDNTAIAAGDLAINGIPTTVAIASGAEVEGLAMEKAFNAVTAINALLPASGVAASLTTLTAGTAATAEGSNGGETMLQSINGIDFAVEVHDGASQQEVADLTVAAINAISDRTGVSARRGNDANGGPENSVVLYNTRPGDETAIVVGPLDNINAGTGLSAGTYEVAANNTGQITLASTTDPPEPFTLTSPNNLDNDDVLDALGLGGGGKGFADAAGDGEVIFGAPPLTGDLMINGVPVSTEPDRDKNGQPLSTIYADASAAAKAAAINKGQYGVRAEIIPAYHHGQGPVHEGTIDDGDLVINGVSIFSGPTAISANDADNTLVRAINAKTADTGVTASRDQSGQLMLTAVDGRNMQIETSAMGGHITHLNNSNGHPESRVYFGSIRLQADQPFSLESSLDPVSGLETGFIALGLAGGAAATGEADDEAGDGIIKVNTIHRDNDYVRYAGDRDNDISIKVGQRSTIEISKNGHEAIFETGVFRILKELEDFLQGDKYTAATGAVQAASIYATLDSEDTGLELADRIVEGGGEFTVTIANHDSSPPTYSSTTIKVDPANDTLEDIAQRLNGIPGLKAAWTDTGYLQLDSTDPQRYSFNIGEDTSGLLDAIGLRPDQIQASALQKSIADLETLLNEQTNQISDFGARANRIIIQNNIYLNLTVATAENLSELEDTDLMQALMEIKAKEVAYQAALNSAAKTMQLSLVNFL